VDPRNDGDDGRVVALHDVSVRLDETLALDRVDLAIPPGTILGLIGPSGAGKTTLIRLLTGSLAPSAGRVEVLGRDPRRFDRRTRERIGYMPQAFTLYPDLTARENVDLIASLFGVLWRTRHRRTREVLEWVDLWEARGRRAGRLSGGMQRRLELACATVHDPALLLLDEPTAGVDPLLRGRIWDGLRALRDEGRSLVVTTQLVDEAESCDNVAMLSEGRLLALETPDGLRRRATGGDIVELETAAPIDAAGLHDVPGVLAVDRSDANHLRVTVEDAATATPDVVSAMSDRGGEVRAAREIRPTFDEVFAALIARDRTDRASVGVDPGASADDRGAPVAIGAGR